MLILDSQAQKVTETNQAADRLLGRTPRRPAGREFLEIFAPKGRELVELLLSGVRATGRADEVRVQLEEDQKDIIVSASPFRQESTTYLLVRLGIPVADANAIVLPKAKTKLLKLVENVPDAFVVTGQDGRILAANAAFLDMAQLPNEDQALGEPLERWLGQPGVEFEVLTASLRQQRFWASRYRNKGTMQQRLRFKRRLRSVHT